MFQKDLRKMQEELLSQVTQCLNTLNSTMTKTRDLAKIVGGVAFTRYPVSTAKRHTHFRNLDKIIVILLNFGYPAEDIVA